MAVKPGMLRIKRLKFYAARAKIDLVFRGIALFSLVFHLVLTLNWFRKHSEESKFWEFVMMCYFLTVFAVLIVPLFQEIRVADDVIFLLNGCIHIEKEFLREGNVKLVNSGI